MSVVGEPTVPPSPYWSDGTCSLYLGDMREVLPALGVKADCIIADPPYESTSLDWDRWPAGWLEAAAQVSNSMWCFLPLRQFAEPPYRGIEFRAAGWRLSHDVAWEKHNGSGPTADRFRGVHEAVTHWYRGLWRDIRHEVPRVPATAEQIARNGKAERVRVGDYQRGKYAPKAWTDDGTRVMRSVIRAKSMHGAAINKTQKPEDLLSPLIEYACPPGGLLIDCFAGSASSLVTARMLGRRAVGIELREAQAEEAARWLSGPVQPVLFGGAA